jgi:hypothetical protein
MTGAPPDAELRLGHGVWPNDLEGTWSSYEH